MGLDISTKNKQHRFNWSGVADFEQWSMDHLGVSAFPDWEGGNGMTVVFNRKPKHEREIEGNMKNVLDWLKAFEKFQKVHVKNKRLNSTWGYKEAIVWSEVLRDAIKCKYINYF